MQKYLHLKPEIEKYLAQNPTCAMKVAAEHFQIPYRSFRKLVQTQLDERYWQVKKPEKKVRADETIREIQAAYKKSSLTARECYQQYCKIAHNVPVTERVFRTICKEQNLVFERTSLKLYKCRDFEKILLVNQLTVNHRTVRRSYLELLNQETTAEGFLRLDPSLTPLHLFRYLVVKDKGCWICGKRTHFGLPISLDLDHITGNCTNHSLSNLRLLCGCCHKLTKTHSVNKPKTKENTENPHTNDGNPVYFNLHPELNLEKLQKAFQKSWKSSSQEKEE